ncbi:hypothetical protein EVAR_71765_1 [Eumeta japonica]|uniref:Uncharacterized protein n=1 Tax=Eumeta variegata TaxID=151549 RepID=A0A4C1SCC3_EUMVA|nr:hypothetical protein EVAR_71765_1 [Eumeta japonica]
MNVAAQRMVLLRWQMVMVAEAAVAAAVYLVVATTIQVATIFKSSIHNNNNNKQPVIIFLLRATTAFMNILQLLLPVHCNLILTHRQRLPQQSNRCVEAIVFYCATAAVRRKLCTINRVAAALVALDSPTSQFRHGCKQQCWYLNMLFKLLHGPSQCLLFVTLLMTTSATAMLCAAIMTDHWEHVKWDRISLERYSNRSNLQLDWLMEDKVAMLKPDKRGK